MEIIVGKTAGFCYGVKKAVESAENEINNSEEQVYCLGEIVHNKQVVNELKEKGIKFVENIDEASNKTIIRAHGIQKEVYEKAKQKNIEIIDCTCPNVLKIHKIAEEYANKGYYIILTGAEKHPYAASDEYDRLLKQQREELTGTGGIETYKGEEDNTYNQQQAQTK